MKSMHQLRSMIRNIIKEALVGRADPRMSGGRVEDQMTAQKGNPSDDAESLATLRADARLIRAQIKKVKAGKIKGQDLSLMQAKLDKIEKKINSKK